MSATKRFPRFLEVELAGERVRLDGAGALVVRDRLCVADLHLDKAAAFQRAGLAVPGGDEVDDLERLARTARRHGVEEVVVLGDFVHAPPRPGCAAEQAFRRWRAHHPDLRVTVILGNHDRPAAEALAGWPLDALEEAVRLGPFLLHHEPVAVPGLYVLGGHLHPVRMLRDGRRDRLRLPVFWARGETLVLPSFGRFTGGHAVEPAPGDRLWGILAGGVFPL